MYIDRLILLLVAGIFLLSPTIIDWWSRPGTPWFSPYLVWLLFILLGYWVSRHRDPHDL